MDVESRARCHRTQRQHHSKQIFRLTFLVVVVVVVVVKDYVPETSIFI